MRSELIAVRAFRGSRRRSVYREHVLARAQFSRIVTAARELGCSLGAPAPTSQSPDDLDKRRAHAFARDVQRVRAAGVLLDLDDDLETLVAVAGWCARTSGAARLQIRLLAA